jgi:hypothetical protein
MRSRADIVAGQRTDRFQRGENEPWPSDGVGNSGHLMIAISTGYLADKNAMANTATHPTMISEATAPAINLSVSFVV